MTTRFVLVAAAATLIAGCGSSSDSGRSASAPAAATTAKETQAAAPAVSHASFVGELDRICRDGNQRADSIRKRAGATTDTTVAAKAYDDAHAVFVRALEQLGALEVPAGDQPAFARYLRAVQHTASLTTRAADALRKQDTATVQTLADALTSEQRHRLDAALDLGADACGR